MRKPTLLAAVLSLFACSPEELAALNRAAAAQVNELHHDVVVRFEDGAARLTVKRQLRNDSSEYQQLARTFILPEGGVATGLRVGTDGYWAAPATLTGTEEATARWDLLRTPGNAAPSTLGLMEWAGEGQVNFNLFGLAPGATANVEYDVELPPVYAAGELEFEYPREELEAGWLEPRFELGTAALTEVVDAEGAQPTAFKLHQRHDPSDVVGARWATYPVDTDRTLWRLEVDAAAELGRAPVRPNVVFVVDASHSEGAAGIAAQLELIAPYLANARDAEVEVVLYRRFAERLFGRFVPASEVPNLLARVPAERLAPGNGSHLELGAGLAAELLARVQGTGRIVLFTDEALRFGFTNELALEALQAAPRDTVLHVVARRAAGKGELSESRDDEADLSPIAAAHGGIFLRVDGHAGDPVLSADTLLGLVRPVRIDSFVIEAPGVELYSEDKLVEGSTVRRMSIASAPPPQVTLTGKIWAREFKRVVRGDDALANRLPALAVGDDFTRSELTDDEMRTVAFLSHAVSPVTSYFAAPPEAAPSVIGTELMGIGGFGTIGSHCGGCGGSISCGWGTSRLGPDLEALLRALLEPGVSACERQWGDVSTSTLTIEATADEVVQVTANAPSTSLAQCLQEAGWALRLGPEFTQHRAFPLSLSR